MSSSAQESNRRMLTGKVVSDANDKTIVVNVERQVPHKLYKKYIRRSKKYHVHDEKNIGKIGDVVRIKESRPHSKLKTWELVEVVENAK